MQPLPAGSSTVRHSGGAGQAGQRLRAPAAAYPAVSGPRKSVFFIQRGQTIRQAALPGGTAGGGRSRHGS